MHIITTSSTRTYSACKRKFKHQYIDLYRLVSQSDALRIGTLTHLGLNLWWGGGHIDEVLSLVEASAANKYDCVMVQEMLSGYDLRWVSPKGYDVLGVERSFDIPIRNPDTGRALRNMRLHGKIDVWCRSLIVEHKTTSLDISPGSMYWKRLAIDNQISNYLLGSGVPKCLYDVIKKPPKHKLATPEEKRKYTASGDLYASHRLHDEAPEDYRIRIRKLIQSDPGKHYQRNDIVRLGSELLEAQYDLFQHAVSIRESERTGCWPRNPDACLMYATECEFFDACCGISRVENDPKFRKKETAHEEL